MCFNTKFTTFMDNFLSEQIVSFFGGVGGGGVCLDMVNNKINGWHNKQMFILNKIRMIKLSDFNESSYFILVNLVLNTEISALVIIFVLIKMV